MTIYIKLIKKTSLENSLSSFLFGADARTRTGTVFPPVDFESTTSANSITPAKLLHKIF